MTFWRLLSVQQLSLREVNEASIQYSCIDTSVLPCLVIQLGQEVSYAHHHPAETFFSKFSASPTASECGGHGGSGPSVDKRTNDGRLDKIDCIPPSD